MALYARSVGYFQELRQLPFRPPVERPLPFLSERPDFVLEGPGVARLAVRWIAGVVFVRDTEIEIAERHPDSLAAPADMDSLAFERHCLAERRAGLRSQLFLEARLEREVSGVDNESAHLLNLAIIE
jgi:hypothetical protein